MDMFKGAPLSTDPAGTYDKLNDELLDTKDTNHHGYVMISKTDSRLIVMHRLSLYLAPLGVVASEGWHQK
jgi:hypothetical protein